MTTFVATVYNGTPSLGSSVFVEIRDPADGTVLITRTNTGIREDRTGGYCWEGSVADRSIYAAWWDEGTGTTVAGEIFVPRVGSTGSSSSPLAATAPASINPLVFTIKRGDTDPSIVAQALVPDPVNPGTFIPWPIPGGSAVKFTMRDSADFTSRTRTAFTLATPKVHATASIDDATNGIMSYGWAVGDTDTDGLFRAEFEVTSGSEIRTFPVGVDDSRNWIAVTIVDDLDPGITP